MIDIFYNETLVRSKIYEANHFETTLFINKGDHEFEMRELPIEAQYSPVYGIDVFDYNEDGYLDILLGGNFFDAKPEAGRYDASFGTLLIGKPDVNWEFIPPDQSGLEEKGQIRSCVRFEKQRLLLIGKNKDEVSALRF